LASPSREWNGVDLAIDPGTVRVTLEVDDPEPLLGYRLHMSARLAFRDRIGGLERHFLDALIIGLGAWQQVRLWTSSTQGPRTILVPVALVFTLSLLARERLPLASRLVSFAALALWAGYAPHGGSSVSYFAGVLLAFWVAGTAPEPRDALLAWAAGGALVAYSETLYSGGGVGDFFFTMLVVSALWLGAFTLGRRTRRARALQERLEQEQVERERRARRAVAEERTRMAHELHDVVAHSLSVAIIQTVAATGELPESERGGPVDDRLRAIEASCRDALAEMRRLLNVLRAEADEPDLAPAPGLASLGGLIERVRGAGVQLDLVTDGNAFPVTPGLDLAAYRVIQEALTNTLKHAPGAHGRLWLRYRSEGLDIEILDDGPGESAIGNGSGRGLVGMRERVALYGGTLEAGPLPDGGFRVHAWLPVQRETA